MPKRGLTSDSIAALGLPRTIIYNLLRIDFTGVLYYTDAPYDILYDDGDGYKTYISTANCPKFPEVKESLGIRPSSVSLMFSGAAANHAITLTENYKNTAVKLSHAINATQASNLLDNGKFETNVNGWTGVNCTPIHDAVNERIEMGFPTSAAKRLYAQFTLSADAVVNFSIEGFVSAAVVAGIDTGTTYPSLASISAGNGVFYGSVSLTAGVYYFLIVANTTTAPLQYDNIKVSTEVDGVLIFDGFMDSYATSEDQQKGKSEVTWNCVSHWANWQAINGRIINDVTQKRIGFSGDLIFQYAGVTDAIIKFWGGTSAGLSNTGGDYWLFLNATGQINWEGYPQWYQDVYSGTTLSGSFYNWEAARSSTTPLPAVYGEIATKGVPIFRGLSGTNSKYLWAVYALSEGECDSLTGDKIQFDGKAYNHGDFAGTVTHCFYSGRDSQATTDTGVGDGVITASSLVSAHPSWTTAHDGKGVCYCIIRYTYNKEIWNSAPEPVFILKGKKLIDPNIPANPPAYSSNPVWILYDYLTNARYGKGIQSTKLIDFDSGATYAESTQTPYASGIAIPLFEMNGAIDTGRTIKQNAEAILFTMRGQLSWVAGKYKLVIENHIAPASVYSFNSDNISGEFVVKEQGIQSILNLVEYEFLAPFLGYTPELVYSDSATFLSIDNGRELRKRYTNKFETNPYRAQNRANSILKQSREIISISLKAANADALKIECGDIIDITRNTQGWSGKLFRVHGIAIKPNGDILITNATEYEPTAFDWSVGTEVIPPSDTELINPFTSVAPTGVTMTTGAVRSALDGTTYSRLKITWTAAASEYIDHYEIEVKETNDAATEWVQLPSVDANGDMFVHYEPVPVGVEFDCRVRSVNSLGKVSGWVTQNNYEITGTNILGTEFQLDSTDSLYGTLYYFRTFFESLDNYTNATNVTKGTNDNGFKMVVTATAVSFVYKWLYNDINQVITWSNDRVMRTAVKLTIAGTGGRIFVGIGFGSSYATFKITWNSGTSKFDIRLEQSKSTVISTSAIIASVNSGVVTELEIRTDAANYKSYGKVNKGTEVGIGNAGSFPVSSKNVPMYYYVDTAVGGNFTVEVDEFVFLQNK